MAGRPEGSVRQCAAPGFPSPCWERLAVVVEKRLV
jgi:hypothetical protein